MIMDYPCTWSDFTEDEAYPTRNGRYFPATPCQSDMRASQVRTSPPRCPTNHHPFRENGYFSPHPNEYCPKRDEVPYSDREWNREFASGAHPCLPPRELHFGHPDRRKRRKSRRPLQNTSQEDTELIPTASPSRERCQKYLTTDSAPSGFSMVPSLNPIKSETVTNRYSPEYDSCQWEEQRKRIKGVAEYSGVYRPCDSGTLYNSDPFLSSTSETGQTYAEAPYADESLNGYPAIENGDIKNCSFRADGTDIGTSIIDATLFDFTPEKFQQLLEGPLSIDTPNDTMDETVVAVANIPLPNTETDPISEWGDLDSEQLTNILNLFSLEELESQDSNATRTLEVADLLNKTPTKVNSEKNLNSLKMKANEELAPSLIQTVKTEQISTNISLEDVLLENQLLSGLLSQVMSGKELELLNITEEELPTAKNENCLCESKALTRGVLSFEVPNVEGTLDSRANLKRGQDKIPHTVESERKHFKCSKNNTTEFNDGFAPNITSQASNLFEDKTSLHKAPAHMFTDAILSDYKTESDSDNWLCVPPNSVLNQKRPQKRVKKIEVKKSKKRICKKSSAKRSTRNDLEVIQKDSVMTTRKTNKYAPENQHAYLRTKTFCDFGIQVNHYDLKVDAMGNCVRDAESQCTNEGTIGEECYGWHKDKKVISVDLLPKAINSLENFNWKVTSPNNDDDSHIRIVNEV